MVHLLVAEAVLIGLRAVQRQEEEREKEESEAWAAARAAMEDARGGR